MGPVPGVDVMAKRSQWGFSVFGRQQCNKERIFHKSGGRGGGGGGGLEVCSFNNLFLVWRLAVGSEHRTQKRPRATPKRLAIPSATVASPPPRAKATQKRLLCS
jgi:hypothetical protein